MPRYDAPYLLPEGQDNLPVGEFLLPVCTTRERLYKLLAFFNSYRIPGDELDLDGIWDIYRAMSHIQFPHLAPCLDLSDTCIDYPPFAPFIEYFPNNPWTQPTLITEGYLLPAWYIAGSVAVSLYDATEGAPTTSLERVPPGSFPSIIPASGLPRIRVNAFDTGTIELHLTALNSGGICQVTVDDDPLQTEFLDMLQSVPTETQNIIIVEREFTTPGHHHIDIIMIPSVQAGVPPVVFGGGLQKVVMCGFDNPPPEGTLIFRQNPENPCILEQSADGETWVFAFDYSLCQPPDCCDEVGEIGQSQNYEAYQMAIRESERIQAEYEEVYDGTPESINPDAPADNFDGDSSIERDTALCGAATAFVRYFATSKVRQLDVVYGGIFTALALLFVLVPGFGWAAALALGIALGSATLVAGTTYNTAKAALQDLTALDDVTCCLVDGLTGQAITDVNFAAGLSSCGFSSGTNAAIVRDFLAPALADNYLLFIDFLGEAKQAVDEGQPVYCACGCIEEITSYVTGENVEEWTVATFGEVVPGEYLDSTYVWGVNPAIGGYNSYRGVHIQRAFGSATFRRIELNFEYIAGLLDTGSGVGADTTLAIYLDGVPLAQIFEPDVPASPYVWEGTATGNLLSISVVCGAHHDANPNVDPGGTARLLTVELCIAAWVE